MTLPRPVDRFLRNKYRGRKSSRPRHLLGEQLENREFLSVSPWDFQVNTKEKLLQADAAVAYNGDGMHVAAWQDTWSSTDTDIRARIYDRYDHPVSGDFIVANTGKKEVDPAVAMFSTGEVVVVWTEQVSATDQNIRGALFSKSGQRLSQFTIAATANREYDASIDVIYVPAAKGFAVSYTCDSGADSNVKASVFLSDGTKLEEFTVAGTANKEARSSITGAHLGFAVAYERTYSTTDTDIRVAHYGGYSQPGKLVYHTKSWDSAANGSARFDEQAGIDWDGIRNKGVVVYRAQGSYGSEIRARLIAPTGFTGAEIVVEDQYVDVWWPSLNRYVGVKSQAARPVVATANLKQGFVVACEVNGGQVRAYEVSGNGLVHAWQDVGTALSAPAIDIASDGHYVIMANSTQKDGEIRARRGFLNLLPEVRRVLYLNFEGITISRADLNGWNSGWQYLDSHVDAEFNGVTVGRFLSDRGDRQQVINRIVQLVAQDLAPYGVQVRLRDAGAVREQAATTVFVGANNIKISGQTGSHVAADIDAGNNNRTDIAFVNEERWFRHSSGAYTTTPLSTGVAFHAEATALAMADCIAHEAGHTFGLHHVKSGTQTEVMGLRYNTKGQWVTVNKQYFWNGSAWIRNTSFMNQQFAALEAGWAAQNSHLAMRAAFTAPFSQTGAAGGSPAQRGAPSASRPAPATAAENLLDILAADIAAREPVACSAVREAKGAMHDQAMRQLPAWAGQGRELMADLLAGQHTVTTSGKFNGHSHLAAHDRLFATNAWG